MSGFGRRAAFGEALLRAARLGAPLGAPLAALPTQADAAPPPLPPPGAAADIRALGAAGDGRTDDTEAFRAALSTHAAVFVPEGTYLVTGPLTLRSATLFGTGPASVLKGGNARFNLLEVGGRGSRVRGLALEGGATDEATGQFGIVTSTEDPPVDFAIHDVRFGGLNSGVKFEDRARDCRVVNNRFERLVGKSSGHGYGVLTGQVDGLIVDGNTFEGSRAGGSGRHAVYVSAGGRRVTACHNIVREFNSEALTTFAYPHQDAVDEIIFSHNILDRCGGEGPTQTAIGIFGRAGSILVSNNIIHQSFGCGMLSEPGPMVQEDVAVEGNVVVDAACVGIRHYGAIRQVVRNNYICGSSRASPGTYADIMVGGGGTHAPESIMVSGNRCVARPGGALVAFLLNATTPLPLSVSISHNDFPTRGYAAAPNFAVGKIAAVIDGRLQFKTVWQPPETGSKSVTTVTFDVAGAEPGDQVTCSHPAMLAGFSLSGIVSGSGKVAVALVNVAASSTMPPGGPLRMDIWKSAVT
jgi:hypothetical protein